MSFLQRYQTGRQIVHNSYLWVTLSATALTVPLYAPHICCWLIFIAYIPLFYAALTYSLTFWHGLWWGLLCWTGQLYTLFWVVYEHGYGQLRMLVPLFLIFYCALHSALCFYVACVLGGKKNNALRTCVWVLCITIYYLIMRYKALWVIGLSTGYPLAFPLLPLAEYPQFLAALPYLTSAGLLVCLLSAAMGIAYYLATHKQQALLLSFCAFLPFFIGFFIERNNELSPVQGISSIVIPPHAWTGMHPRDCAQEINACITDELIRNGDAQILILPESSYPFVLHEHEDAITLWSINALNKGQLLILGSYYEEEGALYNGIYGIKECRVIFSYVKNCRMPFTEYVPFPWSMCRCMRTVFLKNSCGFSSKESDRIVSLTDQYKVQLALCSEFFFDAYDSTCPLPLLVLVNDSWFSCTYIHYLMYLFARYTALSRSVEIMYSSYNYVAFIDKRGLVIGRCLGYTP